MGIGKDEGEVPLLLDAGASGSDVSIDAGEQIQICRTGTLGTAIAHIITAVIGSGVLSLAWSVAQLGWVAGPLAMVCFAAVTQLQSSLLADCYRYPDPEHGHVRCRSYIDAVRLYLGPRSVWVCGIIQYVSLYGCGVAYTITSAKSIKAILQSNCYHKHGHMSPCTYDASSFILVFGAVEAACSLIPSIHSMGWLSTIATAMSFTYATIGFALGLSKTIGNGVIKGSITGVPAPSAAQKTLRVSQALGDIAFAYPFSVVLLEIQDTLRSPPAENQTMKRACWTSISITTGFYLLCGCLGYAAFGDDTPGNLLTGFGFYEPYWLVDLANACVIVHIVGGYQVYSQPIFSAGQRWLATNFPTASSIQLLPQKLSSSSSSPSSYNLNLPSLCFRIFFVGLTTGVALLFPYFNEVLGVLGAFGFWPCAIYFPVQMHLARNKVRPWSGEWVALQAFSAFCFAASMFAFFGSVQGLLFPQEVDR